MSTTSSGVVERLLADRIGLDASSVGPSLIARGVHARMAALGVRSRAVYEKMLTETGDELQWLVEEVVVPESWFFRDARPFEALAGFARTGWLLDPARPLLNVLSLPCAGGEEPYSIAITLLEAGLPADRFRVDAVDVSARSLSRAIAGVFGPNSFRGNDLRVRPFYFREQAKAFTIVPEVRSTVHFHRGNLLDSALFADRPPFDIVFCRNLLIYFDDQSCARAFATLGRLLADGGLLFLGHADRPDIAEGSLFVPTGDKGCFAFRKGERNPKMERASRASSSLSLRVVAPPVVSNPTHSGAVLDRRHPSPPAPLPGGGGRKKGESAGATFPGKAGARTAEFTPEALRQASVLADQGRYEEATHLVEGAIRDGKAGAGAFFLLGMIRQAAGDRDRAEGHFLKAVYLDAQHDEALLALALLARRKGDVAAESVYRRRAERVLARKGAS